MGVVIEIHLHVEIIDPIVGLQKGIVRDKKYREYESKRGCCHCQDPNLDRYYDDDSFRWSGIWDVVVAVLCAQNS